jgi:hypothetical protein
MKLHHFISQKKTIEEGERIRNLGKSLAQVVSQTPAVPIVEAKKKVTSVEDDDTLDVNDKVQAHRKFAERQLAKSNPSVHHKICQFD